MRTLNHLSLPRTPYEKVLELQRATQQALIKGESEELLITCEHDPVITLGTSAEEKNLLAPSATITAQGISVLPVERGGDVTYHGPGQIVMYPLINLTHHRKDVGWYMRNLEEVMIRTLARYQIQGERLSGKAGVWLPSPACGRKDKKIGSVGVRISRWCTLHGLALNVEDCSKGFSLINPCGFADIEMTSIVQEGSSPTMKEVEGVLCTAFAKIFGYTLKSIDGPQQINSSGSTEAT